MSFRPATAPRARAMLACGAIALLAATIVAFAEHPVRAAGLRGEVRLLSQTAWVEPDRELVLRLAIDGVDDVDDAELAVLVYPRLTSRSAFQLTLRDTEVARPIDVTFAPLAELDRDPGGAVVVRLPLTSTVGDPERLLLRREGVYPVAVELRERGGGPVASGFTTHLVRLPAARDITPLAVAWVHPIDAPPSVDADGHRAMTERIRSRVERQVRPVSDVAGIPLTIAAVPETLDSLGAGGEEGAELLDTLRGALAGRQVLTGTYVPVDVAAFVGAGLDDELPAQLARGAAVTAEHLALRPDARTFVAYGRLDDSSVARLRALGVDRLIVTEATLTPIDLPVTLTRTFRIGGTTAQQQQAAVADALLARHFERVGPPALRAHQLLADLAVLFFDNPGLERGAVILPPPGWSPDAELLGIALRALARSPILAPVTIDAFFDAVPPATVGGEPLSRRVAPLERPALGVPVSEMRAARQRLLGYAAMTDPDNPRFAEIEKRLFLAQHRDLTATARRTHLAGASAALEDELALVQLPEGQGITLTAREGTIPVAFQNRASYPMRVVVRLESDKLDFRDGSTREVTLDPGTTTLQFAVRARTPGAFALRVAATSPDGLLAVAETRFTVRSTAVSGVGVVLSAVAGLFLLAWWGRHWRTVRRDARLIEIER